MARKRGFTKQKVNFWQIIRNPVYCGKVIVPKYKNEEASLAKGQHEPIIPEYVFYDAQDDPIPLRGFLICPKCTKNLSASASTGRSSRYYYYHCTAKCGFRCRASKVNEQFEAELAKYTPVAGILDSI